MAGTTQQARTAAVKSSLAKWRLKCFCQIVALKCWCIITSLNVRQHAMSGSKSLVLIVVFGMTFSPFSMACNDSNSKIDKGFNEKEFNELKSKLFDKTSTDYETPIYADPPTADYEDVKKGIFLFQMDSIEIEKIKKYRNELEPYIVQHIDSGYTWVYLAAFLKYESAIPKITSRLLACHEFYGWEGPDYSKIESYLNDDYQYCYQMAYISAIEYIRSKPIREAIILSNQEYDALKENASKCVEVIADEFMTYCAARWLLKKMDLE